MAKKLIWNPITSDFDWIDEATPSTDLYKVDKIELDATDISNKYVLLTTAPVDATKTRLVVIGGIEQDYSVDFEVTVDDAGRRLSWDSLGLDGVLISTDKIVVVYS